MKKAKLISTILCISLAVSLVSVVLPINVIEAHAYSKAYQLPKLTGNAKTDIIAIAKSQVGYTQDTNGTVYGEWYTKYINNSYNHTKSSWCAIFLSWCSYQAGIPTSIVPITALSRDSATFYQDKKLWHDAGGYTPKVGDFVYFAHGDTDTINHIGLVYNVNTNDKTISIYEGNKVSQNGMVGTGKYSLYYSDIVGYATPKYGAVENTVSVPENNNSMTTKPTITISYPEPTRVLSEGCKGNDVKWLQYCLNTIGKYGLKIDGVFGKATTEAVKNLQKKYGLVVDGYAGTKTIQLLKSKLNIESIVVVPDKNYSSQAVVAKVNKLAAGSASTTSIKLTWTKAKGASGYVVERYDSKAKKYKAIKTVGATTYTYTDTNLAVNVVYKYRVRGYKRISNVNKYGAYSNTVSCLTKPAKMTAKLLNAKSREVKVYWTCRKDVSGYEVYRATSKNGKYTLRKQVTKNTITAFINTGLNINSYVYYKVRAYKLVNGKKVYGGFSDAVGIKVK